MNNRIVLADLHTLPTADTHCGVNDRSRRALVLAYGRATEFDARAALGARVFIDGIGIPLVFHQERTRGSEDDHREFARSGFLGKRAGHRGQVVRIDDLQPVDAESLDETDQVNLVRGAFLERNAVDRVSLMARHGRDPIVQDCDRAATAVVDGIHERARDRNAQKSSRR